MAYTDEKSNPFLSHFTRKLSATGRWVSLGEKKKSLLDVTIEVNQKYLEESFRAVLCQALEIKLPSEKKMLRFLFSRSKDIDVRNETCHIDLDRAQRHHQRTFKKSISKSSFQRSMMKFHESGLISATKKRSWFYLNPDVFDSKREFSITTNYVASKRKAEREGMGDFFSGDECMFVSRR